MQEWISIALIWIGFSIIVGICAEMISPGGNARKTVGSLLIGLTGAVLGPLAIDLIFRPENFNPVGILGFLPAVAISVILLSAFRGASFSYRLYEKHLEELAEEEERKEKEKQNKRNRS